MSLQGTFKALSDPIRRDILIMLKEENKMIAGDIAQRLGISPAALSYHLSLLKKNDLIIETKEKNFVCYELNISLFDELIIWLKQF